jgi:hypothetical protein
MSISYSENDDTKVAKIVVSGRITRADYDEAVVPLQAFIDRHGTVKLIEVIESFDGFEPSMLWPGIKFDFKNIRHFSHVAVVSDIGWIGPLSKAAGALLTTQLRTFDLAELDAAEAWLASA